MSSVFLVDTYNMLHRARFGFATGPHAITFNFFRSLRSEFERHSPSKVYMVLEGYPIHRVSESNGEYKANRETDLEPSRINPCKGEADLAQLVEVRRWLLCGSY